MEATASFEEEEVGNEAHVHDRKVILLFGMAVTPDRTAFCWLCNSEVSPLYLRKPHPRIKKLTFCLNEKLDILGVQCLLVFIRHKVRNYLMETQPSDQHHLGLKKLHTCDAGAWQKSVKGKCQNDLSFVCVCARACAYVFSSVDEQLGVDIKTKSHCSLRLCLLHNKPLALTRHIGFFPRPAVWSLTELAKKHRVGLVSSVGVSHIFSFAPPDCIMRFPRRPVRNARHQWIILKFGIFKHSHWVTYTVVCILTHHFAQYIYFLLPFSDLFEYLGWQWRYSFFFIPALSVWDIMKSISPDGQELSAFSDTFLSHSPLMVIWNFQL